MWPWYREQGQGRQKEVTATNVGERDAQRSCSAGDRLDTDERLCGDLGVWGAGPLAVRLRQAPVGSLSSRFCLVVSPPPAAVELLPM